MTIHRLTLLDWFGPAILLAGPDGKILVESGYDQFRITATRGNLQHVKTVPDSTDNGMAVVYATTISVAALVAGINKVADSWEGRLQVVELACDNGDLQIAYPNTSGEKLFAAIPSYVKERAEMTRKPDSGIS